MNDDIEFKTVNNMEYIVFDAEAALYCLEMHMHVFFLENDNLIPCVTNTDIEYYKNNNGVYLCPSKDFEDFTKDIFSLPFDDPDLDINF